MNYKDYFSQRHITVVGLGPHFEMVPEVAFLLKEGARVTVVDPRSPAKLGSTLTTLQGLGLEKLVTGRFAKEDIHVGDTILLAPDVNPKDSAILEAEKMGIKIETVQTFFISLLPPITLIGVMGNCGKSTVSFLTFEMLKRSNSFLKDQSVFNINPDVSNTLSLLKKVKKGDVIISRIPEEHAHIYYTSRIVPHVAVYTNLNSDIIPKKPVGLGSVQTGHSSVANSGKDLNSIIKPEAKDACKQCGRVGACLHRPDTKTNFLEETNLQLVEGDSVDARTNVVNNSSTENNSLGYKQSNSSENCMAMVGETISAVDMFSILSLQTYNNFIVANDSVIDLIKESTQGLIKTNAKMLRTGLNIIPNSWDLKVDSFHEKENLSLAIRVAELFKIETSVCKKVAEEFAGLKGRMELVRKVGGLEFYNDSASVNPLSTLTALKALSKNRNVVLIMGGAFKGGNMKFLIDNLPQYTETVILLPGSGTLRCHRELLGLQGVNVIHAGTIAEAVRIARDNARKFDRILYSPGFAVGGFERSVAERGTAFVTQVKRFKK